LQLLTEDRRQLVNERTRYSNRLTANLKSHYPQLLQWFDDLYAPVTLDFLEQWPTLEELQKAKPGVWSKFFQEHRCRDAKNQQLLAAIPTAVTATTDFAVVTAGRAGVCTAVRLLRNLNQAIQEYDRQIDQLAKGHPDFALFQSLPGAGKVLVPRLIAAFGTQRDRYQRAAEIQQYSGIAPVTEASGQQRWVHWRWGCPKFRNSSGSTYRGSNEAGC
jgi:transposase